MNKYKKIAAIAITAVMAGSMVGMMAACGGSTDEGGGGSGIIAREDFGGYTSGTTLNMNVGNNNNTSDFRQGISYRTAEISGSARLPDGNNYQAGNLKPAWQALQNRLQVNFNDVYQNNSSNAQITSITDGEWTSYDVITGSLATINENASKFVNLSKYLSVMPNYYTFLRDNPVVMYSLTGNPLAAEMYAAPYFDGLNDIEKYELFNQNWVIDILDDADYSDANITFAAQATAKGVDGTKSSATAYMGTTGTWDVETTTADGSGTTTLRVNYDAALAAATNTGSPLGSAIQTAADGTAYNGTSGNIVDLMNHAINTSQGGVTGAELIAILRAYIGVAYQTTTGSAFYTTLSDVFNGQNAGWDVDLLTALTRCVVTSQPILTQAKASQYIYGIAARQARTQRRVDLITLAGTLYGFRGADNSRYEYAYIDSAGNLRDSRSNAETYELLAQMSGLSKEGLIYTGTQSNTTVVNPGENVQAMMIHDYAQTQTKSGLTLTGVEMPKSVYNFAPVVTPVSKWDTNDDGTHETVMRFTESWRSVKNTGFCIPLHVESDTNKLNAVLAFIDYLFSEDGQILMTYGPEATNGNSATGVGYTNGWWKGQEVTMDISTVADVYVTSNTVPTNEDGTPDTSKVYSYFPTQYVIKPQYADDYFVYNGKVYRGTSYNGTVVPTITDKNREFYLGNAVDGTTVTAMGNEDAMGGLAGDYTNYARRVVGTTLPIGNKNQGFEYQCTAECALDGAAKVSVALNNGTIKHVKLSLDQGESLWYLICPTAMPYSNADRTVMGNPAQTLISGTYFLNSSSSTNTMNAYIDLIYYGFDTTKRIAGRTDTPMMMDSGEKYVTWINEAGLTARLSIMQRGWDNIKRLYNI